MTAETMSNSIEVSKAKSTKEETTELHETIVQDLAKWCAELIVNDLGGTPNLDKINKFINTDSAISAMSGTNDKNRDSPLAGIFAFVWMLKSIGGDKISDNNQAVEAITEKFEDEFTKNNIMGRISNKWLIQWLKDLWVSSTIVDRVSKIQIASIKQNPDIELLVAERAKLQAEINKNGNTSKIDSASISDTTTNTTPIAYSNNTTEENFDANIDSKELGKEWVDKNLDNLDKRFGKSLSAFFADIKNTLWYDMRVVEWKRSFMQQMKYYGKWRTESQCFRKYKSALQKRKYSKKEAETMAHQFAKKYSKPHKSRITRTMNSHHFSGKAADIVFKSGSGKTYKWKPVAMWNGPYNEIAKLAAKHGIKHPLPKKDANHFEMA